MVNVDIDLILDIDFDNNTDLIMINVRVYAIIDSLFHGLYFLMNLRNSSNEILPELSLSIWLKFHWTISWVIGMLSGLKVSSISFLNSPMSISSSSLSPYFFAFLESLARFRKKWSI